MYDVFISYSSKDADAAKILLQTLEKEGIKCWIAPRNIPEGREWADEIVHAIKKSRFFVLLFSINSNRSKQVLREITVAIDSCEIIFPLKLDNTIPTGSMEYYLSVPHWANTDLQDIRNAAQTLSYRINSLIESLNEKEPEDESKIFGDTYNASKNALRLSSMRSIKQAADNGDVEAQYKLGIFYMENIDENIIDTNRGTYYLSLASKQDYPQAQLRLAKAYKSGNGVPQNNDNVFKLLEQSAKQLPEAMFLLGECYANGIGCIRDSKKALICYLEAAKYDYVDAMLKAANWLQLGKGGEKNLQLAFSIYLNSARKGNDKAMFEVGLSYYLGKGTDVDKKKAAFWWAEAADHGNVFAAHNLGITYENGEGVEKNINSAIAYYYKAAERNHIPSMQRLYSYYHDNMNDNESFIWAKKCADINNIWGYIKVGFAYEHGNGVKKNFKEAVKYYRLASDQGDSVGQFSLGRMYLNGFGTKRNIKEAKKLFEKSATQNNIEAQIALSTPTLSMIPEIKNNIAATRKWLFKAVSQKDPDAMVLLALYYSQVSFIPKVLDELPAVASIWIENAYKFKEAFSATSVSFLKPIEIVLECTRNWEDAKWIRELHRSLVKCCKLQDYYSVHLCAKKLLTYPQIDLKPYLSKLYQSIIDCEPIESLANLIIVYQENGNEYIKL